MIAVLALVGWLAAHVRILDMEACRVLSKVAFHIACPALLVTVMQRASTDVLLSPNVVVSGLSAVAAGALYVLITRRRWPDSLGGTTLGALSAGYVNAGNLGIAIAAYVLSDVAWVAPTLLLQLLVFTPVAMALLDADARGERPTPLRSLRRMTSNPITIGAVIGLVLNLTGWRLPTVLGDPVDLMGAMAVPIMLIAFGISLRLGPRPASGGTAAQVWWTVALKTVAQPAVAAALGAFVFGLGREALFAVTVMAALPTAQNVFTYAVRYDRAVDRTRDVVFVSTFVSVPVIIAIAALFHL